MRQRILIVDEAWILMQYPDSAKYLYSLAKRARKYFLGLTIISQDVEDFLSSEQGRAILNNSSLQMLLKQSPAAVEKLGQVFHLTEGEKFLLLESDVGEGLFFAGASHVAIKIVASYAEDQIITTDPKQLLEQREQENKENSIEGQAIEGDPSSGYENSTFNSEAKPIETPSQGTAYQQTAYSATPLVQPTVTQNATVQTPLAPPPPATESTPISPSAIPPTAATISQPSTTVTAQTPIANTGAPSQNIPIGQNIAPTPPSTTIPTATNDQITK